MTLLPDAPPALGRVLVDDRGSLPFALVHGEALVAAAAWSLGEAGITAIDHGTPWEDVVDAGEPLVLHDSLCPMTPPEFLVECLRAAAARDRAVVGVRAVTDTIKRLDGDLLGETLDREALAAVCSPLVLPARLVAELDGDPGEDLLGLLQRLTAGEGVDRLEAPAAARRVSSEDDVAALAALTAPDAR